jgi:hypothetical protein
MSVTSTEASDSRLARVGAIGRRTDRYAAESTVSWDSIAQDTKVRGSSFQQPDRMENTTSLQPHDTDPVEKQTVAALDCLYTHSFIQLQIIFYAAGNALDCCRRC